LTLVFLATGKQFIPFLFTIAAPFRGYTHKTSGFKTSGFKTSGFKTSGFKTSGLQNIRFTKRQVSKRLVSKQRTGPFGLILAVSQAVNNDKILLQKTRKEKE
jgi:hypothetical protein